MNKVKIIILALVVLIGISRNAYAEIPLLQPDDFVGFTFWFVTIASLATTLFLFMERNSVASGWRLSITVSSIVTVVAFIHSIYISNIWITTGDAPTIYRYLEWLITMPLLIIQFYLVLSAVKKISILYENKLVQHYVFFPAPPHLHIFPQLLLQFFLYLNEHQARYL